MVDPREAILARLLVVAAAVAAAADPAFEARRNATELPDTAKWVVLLDGDEEADDGDNDGRTPLTTPRHITMTPEVQFRLQAKAPDVGTKLNAMRLSLILAILGDAALLALTVNGKGIRYRGSATVVEQGRRVDGGIGVAFAFRYVLRPSLFVADVTA